MEGETPLPIPSDFTRQDDALTSLALRGITDPEDQEHCHRMEEAVVAPMTSFDDNVTLCTEALLLECERVTNALNSIGLEALIPTIVPNTVLVQGESHPRPAYHRRRIRASCILSLLLATITTALLVSWNHAALVTGLLANGQRDGLLMKLHVLWMTLSFCFATMAIISFRLTLCSSPQSTCLRQSFHVLFWILAATSGSIGFVVLLYAHKHHRQNDKDSHIWNLDAYFGIAAMIAFMGHIFLGCAHSVCGLRFYSPQLHRIRGIVIYATKALALLLGIQEQEDFAGCCYDDGEESTLAKGWGSAMFLDNSSSDAQTTSICLQSDALSFLIFAMTLCTCLALLHDYEAYNERYTASSSNQREPSLEHNGLADFDYHRLADEVEFQ